MTPNGQLFVISAPSGAGKSSLVRALLASEQRLELSISHTTRPPRGQEVHGREYFFVSDEEFDRMIAAGAFVEWAHVHGRRYGTSRQAIADKMARGVDVVLEIDYQGALQIRRLFAEAVLIFILPPSWEELRKRLLRRGEDSMEAIEMRLRNAEKEIAHIDAFDYVIINESFEQALSDLRSIICAQRLRTSVQRRARADVFRALGIP